MTYRLLCIIRSQPLWGERARERGNEYLKLRTDSGLIARPRWGVTRDHESIPVVAKLRGTDRSALAVHYRSE